MKENFRQPLLIAPVAVVRILSSIIALLFAAHFAGMVVTHYYPQRLIFGIYSLVDVCAEQNIPTLFSSCLFLLNAILCIVAGQMGKTRKDTPYLWITLALLFLFLSVDELSGLHERLIKPVRESFQVSGLFYFAWVIPYGAGVLVLAAVMVPFLWRMERRIRFWFFLSAITFLTGAIGMEMLGGASFDLIGKQDPEFVKTPLYQFLGTLEELLEMSGLVMLTYALLSLLQTRYHGFTIILTHPEQEARPETTAPPLLEASPH